MEAYIRAVTDSTPKIAEMLNGCSWGMLECCLEELHYARGALDKAEAYAMEALHKSREKRQHEIEFRSLFFLFLTFYGQGNTEGCRDIHDQMKGLLGRKEFRNRHLFFDGCMGIFYSLIGQPSLMPPWSREAPSGSNGSDSPGSTLSGLSGSGLVESSTARALEAMVTIRYLVAEKRYAAALGLLQEDNREVVTYLFGRIIFLVLEAICLYHLKEFRRSMKTLEEARTLAEPNGLDMLFIEEGREMRALASYAIKDTACTIDRTWLDHIARRASAHVKKTAQTAAFFSGRPRGRDRLELTRREQEILSGLALGITRQELAYQQGLSLNTVKSMIKNIYNKLTATNLMEAVSRARAQGLLKD